jgi:hypothetical protein
VILRPVLRPLFRSPLEAGGGFSPTQLFAAGEQGAWYDPSDLSSMYQESTGVTPAVVGQPVGLLLDKRLGLVRGAELVTNGTFGANVVGWTGVAGSTATWSAGRMAIAGPGAFPDVGQSITTVATKLYEVTFDYTLVGASTAVYLNVDYTGGLGAGVTVVQKTGLAALSSGSVRGVFRATGAATGIELLFDAAVGGTVDNVSVKLIPGNHAIQATAASRPTLLQDASGRYYLSFDGVDDGLATSAIDFTATDKMTVWAGVHKASDAAAGMLCELNTTPAAGTFTLYSPAAAAADYGFLLQGGANQAMWVSTSFAAPVSNVVSASFNIAGAGATTEVVPRINGVTKQSTLVFDANPTGNFGNYAFYIGRRGGTTLPFNGRIYSLIIRGAASSASQIAAAERWAAQKTGVAL